MALDAGGEEGRMIIRISGDASEFVEEVKRGRAEGEAQAKDIGVSFDTAFKGAAQEVKIFGRILRDDMRQNKVSLEQAFQTLQTGVQQLGFGGKRDLPAMTEAFKRLGGSIKDSGDDASKAESSLSKFIKTGLRVVGVASAVQVLRQVIRAVTDLVKESIEEFRQYSFEVFRLDVAVRAAQRRMGEAVGTTGEWRDFIMQLREQFRIFSTRDLTAATARIILLTRELKFNRTQVEQVIQSSIVLAETMGVKVEEAARRLTLFLDTGYSRGLAALGLQISRVTVEQEAQAQGLEKSWNEMTRAERAAVSLTVVQQQLEAQVEDAGRAVETFQGQMLSLAADQSDAMLDIGENLGFLALAAERVKTRTVEAFASLTPVINEWARNAINNVAKVIALFATAGNQVAKFVRVLQGDITAFSTNIGEEFVEFTEQIVDQLNNELFPAMSEMGNVAEDEFGILAEGADEAGASFEDMADAYEKGVEQIEKELQRLEDAQADALQKMNDSLDDQAQRFADQQEDLLQKHLDRLEDINAKFDLREEKAKAKAAQKEAQVEAEKNEAIARAQEEFRLEEIRAEREFILEMERLEREFLFSLEDAVRERDARQVLMLMRRFNLDKMAREEDFEEAKRQREEDLALEIELIKRRAELRKAAIRAQLAIELADLKKARARERKEEQDNLSRALEQLRIQNERRNEDIRQDYERRLRDLDVHHRRRLRDIGQNLVREFNLNAQQVQDLAALWAGYFNWWINMQAVIQGAMSGLDLPQAQTAPPPVFGPQPPTGFARGGGMIANRPTLAQFGEAGPELGSFIPLNRLGEVMGGGGGGQRIGLDISVKADDRLVVEVAEAAMNEIADVIIDTEREM
jgi:hypothetical protein